MKKTNKKGFTIVELVIVIAVIAILAAVLIPTFISLTKKANQSADIQAVNQMNKQLVIANAETPITNVYDAILALDKVNIDLENYKPLASDHYFFFVVDKDNVPMVVYTDADYTPIYPENVNIEGCQLMSLSGAIPMDDSWKNNISNGKVEITSGEQLASLMEAYTNNAEKALEVTTITLKNDVDLRGANANFKKVTGTLTFNGNGKKLSGLRTDENSVNSTWDGKSKLVGYGLFGNVANSANVTVKDLTITGAVISNTAGNKAFGSSGILFGNVEGAVNIESVTISNCTVIGADKVGSLIGQINGTDKTIKIQNVTVSNVKLLGVGWIAKAVGALNHGTLIFGGNNTFESVTVGLNEAQWSTVWDSGDENWLENDRSVKIEDVKTYDTGVTTANKKNTYLPYATNSGCHYEGMCTEDWFWSFNWTEVTVGTKTAYVPSSGSGNTTEARS